MSAAPPNRRSEATVPTLIVAARRERDVRPHRLQQIEGTGAPRLIPLDREEFVLGRDEAANIRINSPRASRRHAFIRRHEEGHELLDNDSRNGVLLNGQKVHSAVLRDGDVIQVADGVFVYHES
jgi:pSer/pThr/pTyr-binding forkhead associated (FHA) protein